MRSPNTTQRKPVQREYLSYSRPGAPDKGARTISPNEKARFGMREQVIGSKALSVGARLLYAHLDDMAAFRGYCNPKEETLSRQLGIAVRSISRFVQELKKSNFVMVSRSRRQAAVFTLGWKIQESPNLAYQEIKTRQNRYQESPNLVENSGSIYLTEPSIEPSVVMCPKCEDFGRVGGWGNLHGEICECAAGTDIRSRANKPSVIGDHFRRRA